MLKITNDRRAWLAKQTWRPLASPPARSMPANFEVNIQLGGGEELPRPLRALIAPTERGSCRAAARDKISLFV